MPKKKGNKAIRTIIGSLKNPSKELKQAIRTAVRDNKGDKLHIGRKDLKNILAAGATKKDLQAVRKGAKGNKNLSIGKKFDTSGEIKRYFKKQRLKGNAPGAENNITDGSGGNNGGGNNNTGGGGLTPGGGNTINVPKDICRAPAGALQISFFPFLYWEYFANRVKRKWTDRFKDYKGPQRLKIKRGKVPARLAKYSQYKKGKKVAKGVPREKIYTGFDTKRYKKDVQKGLVNRYQAMGGKVQNVNKIERMIKRDGPKADFKIKPKYSETMDGLRDQLGGDVKYGKTLGRVTQALAKPPEFRGDDLKNTGMNILKSRTTEDAAVSYPSTIETGPRETKNTPVNNRPKLYKKFPTIKRNKSKK